MSSTDNKDSQASARQTKPRRVTHFSEAKIIAVYNQKGGCGKTMTAMQLGGVLGLRGYRVLILDMDKQRTASIWCSQAGLQENSEPFPATVMEFTVYQGQAFARELEKHSRNYDFIILDCPPLIDSREPWHALLVADMGIVPVMPVADNVWASSEAFALGTKAQVENEALQLCVLPSRVGRGTIYDAFMETLVGIVREHGISMAPVQFSQLNAYPTSQAVGATVFALGARGKAAQEVDAFASWVLKVLSKRR